MRSERQLLIDRICRGLIEAPEPAYTAAREALETANTDALRRIAGGPAVYGRQALIGGE